MADTITRTVVIGAARLLANELTAVRPQVAEDVVDFTTFESINHWLDIGVTKTGVLEINDDILVGMSEVNLDKLNGVASGGPFQLVALWNDKLEDDEGLNIGLRSYPSVVISEIDEPEVMHEGKVTVIKFSRYP